MNKTMTSGADTIQGNLEQLLEFAKKTNGELGTELHRIYVDLREGVAELKAGN